MILAQVHITAHAHSFVVVSLAQASTIDIDIGMPITKKTIKVPSLHNVLPTRLQAGWAQLKQWFTNRSSQPFGNREKTWLFHIRNASLLMHGVEAEVSIYPGGTHYMSIQGDDAPQDGIYLAKVRWTQQLEIDPADMLSVGTLRSLRYLMSAAELKHITSTHKKQLPPNVVADLIEICTALDDDPTPV